MVSLDRYMIQTPVDEWSLLGFLKYRKEQKDFSVLKDKEHYRYQMSLVAVLHNKFTTAERTKAQYCLDNFKNDVKEEHIGRFWHNLLREKQESELITLGNEMKHSQKEKDLLVECTALQHAKLLYATAHEAGKQSQIAQQKITNELNERKIPAENTSPVMSSPNLRDLSPPPPYKSEDNPLNDYNEESTEVEEASTEASPDEIDVFFQSAPDVVKNIKTKTRKHKLMEEDTGSKNSTKGAKRNKSNNIIVDAGQSTSVPSMNVQRTSTDFNPEDVSGTEDAIVDAGQTANDESESSVQENTTEKSEKSRTILSWGHVADKIKISNNSDHDWLANGYNISRDFREFQIQVVDQLKNDLTFSYATDVDKILCLSSIIYVKEDKPKYIKCSDQVWKTALPKPLTPASLPISAQMNIMEYSMLLTNKEELDIKWHQNWSKWDPSMTKEEKSMFDCVQLVTRNFFLNLPSDNIKNVMDEDTFVHRYCHLMFEEIFSMNHLKFVWANGESNSSKERRKSNDHKHGRKPDLRVLFNKEYEIAFGEIKPPSASNSIVNQTLIKLAEFMKGSLDSLHKQFGYSPTFETFGIIIGGSCIRLFSMDIAFDGLYRFKQIGKVLLPTEVANFLTIVPVIANLYSLLKCIDHSIDELNRPSTPTVQSYHRESNSSPHKVHVPVLKIPPPALSD